MAEDILNTFNLDKDRKVKLLSSSGRQRLMCAIALLSKASVLILDEPWKSFDYQSKRLFITQIKQIFMKSVLYMTTDPVDAEIINEQVMIIIGGRAEDTNFASQLMNENFKKHIV